MLKKDLLFTAQKIKQNEKFANIFALPLLHLWRREGVEAKNKHHARSIHSSRL
jgi:hypothetical protein